MSGSIKTTYSYLLWSVLGLVWSSIVAKGVVYLPLLSTVLQHDLPTHFDFHSSMKDCFSSELTDSLFYNSLAIEFTLESYSSFALQFV